MIYIFLIYIFLSFFTATMGRNTKLGFWGTFIMAILLTPVLTAILLIAFRAKRNLR